MAYDLVKCTCNYGTVDADKDGYTQAIHCPHCYQYRKLGAPLGFKVVEKPVLNSTTTSSTSPDITYKNNAKWTKVPPDYVVDEED